MVLKAAFFLSLGTAWGMHLAQEYEGMPNVKKFTTGLVSAPSWCYRKNFCRWSKANSNSGLLQFFQAKELEKDLRKDKGRGD